MWIMIGNVIVSNYLEPLNNLAFIEAEKFESTPLGYRRVRS